MSPLPSTKTYPPLHPSHIATIQRTRACYLHQAFHLADAEASGCVVARHQEIFLLDADGLASKRRVQHLFHLPVGESGRNSAAVRACYGLHLPLRTLYGAYLQRSDGLGLGEKVALQECVCIYIWPILSHWSPAQSTFGMQQGEQESGLLRVKTDIRLFFTKERSCHLPHIVQQYIWYPAAGSPQPRLAASSLPCASSIRKTLTAKVRAMSTYRPFSLSLPLSLSPLCTRLRVEAVDVKVHDASVMVYVPFQRRPLVC